MSAHIKPNQTSERDRRRVEEFWNFLQGTVPDGYTIDPADVPKLTPDAAWTVVWFVQNTHDGFPDSIERCCVCGSIFHTWTEGGSLDYGEAPYNFCGSCVEGDEYKAKQATAPDDD